MFRNNDPLGFKQIKFVITVHVTDDVATCVSSTLSQWQIYHLSFGLYSTSGDPASYCDTPPAYSKSRKRIGWHFQKNSPGEAKPQERSNIVWRCAKLQHAKKRASAGVKGRQFGENIKMALAYVYFIPPYLILSLIALFSIPVLKKMFKNTCKYIVNGDTMFWDLCEIQCPVRDHVKNS